MVAAEVQVLVVPVVAVVVEKLTMTTALLIPVVTGAVMAPDLARVKQITVTRPTPMQMLRVMVVARVVVRMVEAVAVKEMVTVSVIQALKFPLSYKIRASQPKSCSFTFVS
jgi:hypothetical protein